MVNKQRVAKKSDTPCPRCGESRARKIHKFADSSSLLCDTCNLSDFAGYEARKKLTETMTVDEMRREIAILADRKIVPGSYNL